MTLRSRDLQAVLSFVSDAHDADEPEILSRDLLDRLAGLFGCEYATYQAYDWQLRIVTAYIPCSNEDPHALPPPYVPESFWTETGAPYYPPMPFHKLSDHFDRRQREEIRDTDESNTEFRVVDALGFRVGDRRSRRSAWLHFDSRGRDFHERDRELALTLRPHIQALWRRSLSRNRVADLTAALERGGAPGAVVLFEPGGRIEHATAEARCLFARWFGTGNGRLPKELEEWSAFASLGDRYSIRRNGSALTVDAVGESTLVLRERSPDDIRLTPREREILALVRTGLTNAEIARRLWVAESTVAKHLEQAYAKLGVHNRTAAVARLAQLSGRNPV